MNKKQAESIFKVEYMPGINRKDKPALREAWHNYTDFLCKDGRITLKQYESWSLPKFIGGV